MGTVEPRYNEHLYSEQIFLVTWRFVIRRFTVVHFQKSCTSWGEVTNRITETSVTIGRHLEKICLGAERHQPQLSSKLKVYRVVELTTLLYAGETRTFYSRHDAQSLLSELPPQTFQNSWQGGNRQGWHPSVCTVLQKAKFRWPATSPGCLKIAATGARLSWQALGWREQKKRFEYCPKAESHKDLEVENPVLGSRELIARTVQPWRRRVITEARAAEKRRTATEEHRKRASQSCSTTHSCLMGSDWPHNLGPRTYRRWSSVWSYGHLRLSKEEQHPFRSDYFLSLQWLTVSLSNNKEVGLCDRIESLSLCRIV